MSRIHRCGTCDVEWTAPPGRVVDPGEAIAAEEAQHELDLAFTDQHVAHLLEQHLSELQMMPVLSRPVFTAGGIVAGPAEAGMIWCPPC